MTKPLRPPPQTLGASSFVRQRSVELENIFENDDFENVSTTAPRSKRQRLTSPNSTDNELVTLRFGQSFKITSMQPTFLEAMVRIWQKVGDSCEQTIFVAGKILPTLTSSVTTLVVLTWTAKFLNFNRVGALHFTPSQGHLRSECGDLRAETEKLSEQRDALLEANASLEAELATTKRELVQRDRENDALKGKVKDVEASLEMMRAGATTRRNAAMNGVNLYPPIGTWPKNKPICSHVSTFLRITIFCNPTFHATKKTQRPNVTWKVLPRKRGQNSCHLFYFPSSWKFCKFTTFTTVMKVTRNPQTKDWNIHLRLFTPNYPNNNNMNYNNNILRF